MEQLQLPDGFRPLRTQVAGHTFQADAVGLLQDANGTNCVLKPLGKPQCGLREVGFYESLQSSAPESVLAQARLLVPRYYHKIKLLVNHREHMFLKLEDLTYGMTKPCIMDIKIGKRTWDPVATPQKQFQEEQKYVNCKQVLGLCVPGFQLYTTKDGDKVQRHGKEYGKQLDAAGFRETIANFLNTRPILCEVLVREILKQLYEIRRWFEVQELLHFYASSLLIAYDFVAFQAHLSGKAINASETLLNGTVETKTITKEENKKTLQSSVDPKHWIKVKMIDFAHVFPADNGSLDTNYLFGLQNLISIIEDLLVVR